MPKIKVKKGSVSLDMTAMCDVAFLLLTFFVLTAKAKPMEPVEVSTPSSIVDLPVPDVDVITLLVDDKGRTFVNLDNKDNSRQYWLDNMKDQFKFNVNAEQTKNFVNGGPIGVPVANLPDYLAADANKKKEIEKTTLGIPLDSSNTDANQLKDWIINARRANQGAKVVIKADQKAPYASIKKVMKTLQDQGVDRFSLLTTQGSAD
jgi:biopolymer transport protein ExbD